MERQRRSFSAAPENGSSARACSAAQRLDAAPVGGELHQLVLREPEQRALQTGGELQVVGRQQHHVGEGEQVEHGDVRGDGDAIGPRRRDAAHAERPVHGHDEGVALARQDEDAARPHALARGQQHPDELSDLARQGVRERGLRRGRCVEGVGPVLRLLHLRAHHARHDDDASGLVKAPRRVELVTRSRHAIGQLVGENAVDGVENLDRRAEGQRQRAAHEAGAGVEGGALEEARHVGQHVRRRALEAEDRLLVVADRKDRARRADGAGPGKEVGGDRPHHGPLVGAGILRLVDQDVLDARIQLVEHPGGGIGARQEIARLHDQVAEIEHRRAPLGRLIGLQDGVADDEQRLGRREGPRRHELVGKTRQALRFRHETVHQARAAPWPRRCRSVAARSGI